MKARDFIIKGIRKCYQKTCGLTFLPEDYILDRQQANDMMYELLVREKPCMISRYGSGEIGVMWNYQSVKSNDPLIKKCIDYIKGESALPWWDELFFKSMHNNMGVFPENIYVLEKLAERYISDSPEIDLLGSMNYMEKYMPLRSDIMKVHIESLYPFFVQRTWTRALKGKRVLVIHPFVHSIQHQYKNRDKLFDNPEIWPEYELLVYRSVQSNAGAEVPFKDWFEALKKMEDDVAGIDFDVALIGCGAYGLPLAAHIKRLGKKAVHLGGGLQLLFGIKGKRWDDDKYHYHYLPKDYNTNYSSLYNEFWCRPNDKETPMNAKNVENACYW